MEFSTRTFADATVAIPVGRIDHSNANSLEQSLAPMLADPAKTPVVLDFTNVTYISSMGLRVLMVASKKMRAKGAPIGVAGLQPAVDEIFEFARFKFVLQVFPTVRDALQAFSGPAAAAYDAASA